MRAASFQHHRVPGGEGGHHLPAYPYRATEISSEWNGVEERSFGSVGEVLPGAHIQRDHRVVVVVAGVLLPVVVVRILGDHHHLLLTHP